MEPLGLGTGNETPLFDELSLGSTPNILSRSTSRVTKSKEKAARWSEDMHRSMFGEEVRFYHVFFYLHIQYHH